MSKFGEKNQDRRVWVDITDKIAATDTVTGTGSDNDAGGADEYQVATVINSGDNNFDSNDDRNNDDDGEEDDVGEIGLLTGYFFQY